MGNLAFKANQDLLDNKVHLEEWVRVEDLEVPVLKGSREKEDFLASQGQLVAQVLLVLLDRLVHKVHLDQQGHWAVQENLDRVVNQDLLETEAGMVKEDHRAPRVKLALKDQLVLMVTEESQVQLVSLVHKEHRAREDHQDQMADQEKMAMQEDQVNQVSLVNRGLLAQMEVLASLDQMGRRASRDSLGNLEQMDNQVSQESRVSLETVDVMEKEDHQAHLVNPVRVAQWGPKENKDLKGHVADQVKQGQLVKMVLMDSLARLGCQETKDDRAHLVHVGHQGE